MIVLTQHKQRRMDVLVPELNAPEIKLHHLRFDLLNIGDSILLPGWIRERKRVDNLIRFHTAMRFKSHRDKSLHMFVFTRIA